jgi:hypothetical protein
MIGPQTRGIKDYLAATSGLRPRRAKTWDWRWAWVWLAKRNATITATLDEMMKKAEEEGKGP